MANESGAEAAASSAAATPTAATEAGSEDRRGLNASRHQAAEGSPRLTPVEAFKIKCLNNALYHDDRERFFAWLNRVFMFFIVASGASALSPFRDAYPLVPALAALLGLANLVFDINGCSRVHSSLRQRFYNLLSDAETITDIASLEKRMILTYSDEPPIMYAVNAVAYINAMEHYGRDEKYLLEINLFYRFIRHLWPFSASSFRTHEEVASGV
jgi:hypothetical protein